MTNHRWHRLMWTMSVSLSAAVGAYACEDSTTSDGVTGGASNGGTAGASGAGGGAGAAGCSCADAHCPTLSAFCAFLGTPDICPATIGELTGINRAQVGCGKRLVSYFNGTGPGYTYLFDVASGELVGGCRYDDVPFGPCGDPVRVSYSFGESPRFCNPTNLSSGLEQDCNSVTSCRSDGVGGGLALANCLPGTAGGGAGGSAGGG
jgi:hypothetical protein